MTKSLLFFLIVFPIGVFAKNEVKPAAVSKTWTLSSSTTKYTISHSFKTIDGSTTKSAGKILCTESTCEFLIAAPVISFDSQNSNRDSHMLQTVRGIQFPDVLVRGMQIKYMVGEQKIPIEIEWGGKKSKVENVSVKIEEKNGVLKVSSHFPVLLSQFAMKAPSLLGFSIKDEVQIHFDGQFN